MFSALGVIVTGFPVTCVIYTDSNYVEPQGNIICFIIDSNE